MIPKKYAYDTDDFKIDINWLTSFGIKEKEAKEWLKYVIKYSNGKISRTTR